MKIITQYSILHIMEFNIQNRRNNFLRVNYFTIYIESTISHIILSSLLTAGSGAESSVLLDK